MVLKMTEEWDKVFPKSEKVNHRKVSFKNHFGIELAADLYEPKDANGRLPAIAVAGPYGAVKEQSSGLYAQEMAERGFVALAFDPSYTGESGGEPRYVTSWDLNVEDFQAAVDYLCSLENVDAEKISIIGVCGWGGVVDPLPEDAPQFLKDYHAYYKTPRGYHARSLNSNDGWAMTGNISLMNTTAFTNVNEIPGAVLIIHGEKAHSRYMGEDAFARMTGFKYETENAPAPYTGNAALGMTKVGNKELLIVEGATHCDLYDNFEKIPFDKIEEFIKMNIVGV